MVVFDTSVLVLVSDPNAKPPKDPLTGAPVTECQARMSHLVKTLTKAKERVLLPTPVLAEYLVKAGADKDERLQEITKSSVFVVAAFDTMAAVECATLEDNDVPKPSPVSGDDSKVKVKFDRQIIATAIARGAKVIYTGDKRLAARAVRSGLSVVMTWDIPLPPVNPQLSFSYLSEEGETAQPPLAASSDWGTFGKVDLD
jgi:predicted nucleic acid-binding protein